MIRLDAVSRRFPDPLDVAADEHAKEAESTPA